MNVTAEQKSELREWILTRPANVRAVMDVFPPASYVMAKEGVKLFCPAPGERGMVARYLEREDGRVLIGVVPMEGGFGFYAECDPDDLVVVDSHEQRRLMEEAIA